MALPDFPNNPTLNEQFTVGTNIYRWDGEKWKALSNADNSLRSQLADVDSTVLVGGVEAGDVGKSLKDVIQFDGVPALKNLAASNGASVVLQEGDKVSTGKTTWRVLSSGTGLSVGGFALIPLNGVYLSDWGIDLTGTLPADTELEEAISLNRTVVLPEGTTRIDTTKAVGTNVKIQGYGPESTIDARMSDVLFEFPTSTGRSVKKWSDFSVISSGSEMTNGVVFRLGGTPSGGALTYTSGYKFENIEVGGGGEFGCIWDISDTFRFTARDCGYTSVTNPVRIRGSVVQCTIDNVTGNNTDYVRSYDGESCGVFMQVRSDYSDAATRVPENVKIMNSGFVTHRRGISSLGLAVTSENNDLDFIRDIGWEYGGGNGHVVTGGYIAHADGNNAFVGVKVTKVSYMEPVDVVGVVFNTYSVGTATQVGVQVGSGDAAPFAETAGVVVRDCKFFGQSESWDFGIQADRNRKLTLNTNRFAVGVIKTSGKAINASNSKNLTCIGNSCNQQELYVSAPVADSVGTVTDNDANVVTQFIAGTFEIARNRNLVN